MTFGYCVSYCEDHLPIIPVTMASHFIQLNYCDTRLEQESCDDYDEEKDLTFQVALSSNVECSQ